MDTNLLTISMVHEQVSAVSVISNLVLNQLLNAIDLCSSPENEPHAVGFNAV